MVVAAITSVLVRQASSLILAASNGKAYLLSKEPMKMEISRNVRKVEGIKQLLRWEHSR